jgi:hypothetical protein
MSRGWDSEPDYGGPPQSPWPVLALGVVFALLTLILIARAALVLLDG